MISAALLNNVALIKLRIFIFKQVVFELINKIKINVRKKNI